MDNREQLAERKKKFAAFLKAEYHKWASNEPGNATQTDFAKHLLVTQASFSNWINEVRPPDRDNLDQLATKLGPVVYDIWEVPRHMPNDRIARTVFSRWHKLSDSQKRHLEEVSANFEEENDSKKKGDRSALISSPAL
jgi:hypothetical protein